MATTQEFLVFLEKLNKLTQETGIIVDTFGDPFYDPSLSTDEGFVVEHAHDRIFFAYDAAQQSYVGKKGDPYIGEQVFPMVLEEDY